VGLTAQHTLQVPAPGPHYNEAAWYKYSSTPGSLGPAVIVGHVDSAAQGPSVFFNLGDLRPGDKVLVTRADGLVAVFRVDGVRRYPKAHFPTMRVYGNTDYAALRLVTCGGRLTTLPVTTSTTSSSSPHSSAPTRHPEHLDTRTWIKNHSSVCCRWLSCLRSSPRARPFRHHRPI
jgi:sortase family protein